MFNRFLFFTVLFSILTSCGETSTKQEVTNEKTPEIKEDKSALEEEEKTELNKPSDLLPSGFRITEQLNGDLNKDGQDDCVLLVKSTNKKNIVDDEDQGRVDRNRRGLIVLLNNKGHFEPIVENLACFSSEFENGGVYYAPELSCEIQKGNLIISYQHGRYGYWSYKFKFTNEQMQLIGYDNSENYGPLVKQETSINFLTRKKQVRVNQNDDPEGEDDFEEEWSKFELKAPILLAEIKDFDELDMSKY